MSIGRLTVYCVFIPTDPRCETVNKNAIVFVQVCFSIEFCAASLKSIRNSGSPTKTVVCSTALLHLCHNIFNHYYYLAASSPHPRKDKTCTMTAFGHGLTGTPTVVHSYVCLDGWRHSQSVQGDRIRAIGGIGGVCQRLNESIILLLSITYLL